MVVDTNVWISGMLTSSGVPGQLIRQVVLRAQPVFTTDTFDELRERLWHPKFDRYVTLEQRKHLLADLHNIARWVEVELETASRHFCRDAADDKFIHAALAAGAACLVTGDKDLLILAEGLLPLGVRVVSPALAWELPELSAFQN